METATPWEAAAYATVWQVALELVKAGQEPDAFQVVNCWRHSDLRETDHRDVLRRAHVSADRIEAAVKDARTMARKSRR